MSTKCRMIPALSQAFVWRKASSASLNNLSSLRQTTWLPPLTCPRSFDPAGRLPRGMLADTPKRKGFVGSFKKGTHPPIFGHSEVTHPRALESLKICLDVSPKRSDECDDREVLAAR